MGAAPMSLRSAPIIVHFEWLPPGKYLYHCHIFEHESNDMMRPFEVIA
jgi:spore coat protein A, manganese oxidase